MFQQKETKVEGVKDVSEGEGIGDEASTLTADLSDPPSLNDGFDCSWGWVDQG